MTPMEHAKKMKLWEQRREKFLRLYTNGWTMRKIAEQEGLSVQRVQQIVQYQKNRNGKGLPAP